MSTSVTTPSGNLVLPFKLGRLKPQRRLGTPSFGDWLGRAKTWPVVRAKGWQYAVDPSKLLMLGNDTLSICGPAAFMHWAQTVTSHTENPLYGTLDQTIAMYSAVTGYDPKAPQDAAGNNPTDGGTVLQQLLDWVMANGAPMTDKNGKEVRFEILAYASLDITSLAQMKYAAFTFGGNYLGINLPLSAMLDTSNWKWDPKSSVIGGHAINQEAEGNAGGHVQSWGRNIPFTTEFMLNSLEEGWIIVSKAWVTKTGKSPSGLDLDGLLAASKSFSQQKTV
jgi:hypothetical protein